MLLDLAAGKHGELTRDLLATIAPLASDQDAPVELIHLVLGHLACSVGVAGRYATHRDATIRPRVAMFPGMLTSQLGMLVRDSDDAVREAAIAALTGRARP